MVIFKSTDMGATKVFDGEECLLSFERQNNNLVKNASGELMRTSKTDDWICAIDDSTEEGKAKIKKILKHPHYNKEFVRVNEMPINLDRAKKTKRR